MFLAFVTFLLKVKHMADVQNLHFVESDSDN
jgi:hypothetical protein